MSDVQTIVDKITAECGRQVTASVDAILAATPGLDVSAAEAINRLHARIAELKSKLAAAESALPATFYADRDLPFRVEMMAQQWRKLLLYQDKVEPKLAAADRLAKAAKHVLDDCLITYATGPETEEDYATEDLCEALTAYTQTKETL